MFVCLKCRTKQALREAGGRKTKAAIKRIKDGVLEEFSWRSRSYGPCECCGKTGTCLANG